VDALGMGDDHRRRSLLLFFLLLLRGECRLMVS
jgi:hypothetical protein